MNEMQTRLMELRAHVELTFTDPWMTTPALAEMARLHGKLTEVVVDLEHWQPTPVNPLPEVNRQSTHKPFKQIKRKKAPQKSPQPRHTTAREVECPLCMAKPGEVCWKMSLGKNSQRTKQHTAGDTSHDARIKLYRAMQQPRKVKEAILSRDPEVAEVVDRLYGAGITVNFDDEPKEDERDASLAWSGI